MVSKVVVFLLPSLKNGGGNRVVIELSNELALLDYDVYIIHPNNSCDVCEYHINDLVHIVSIGDLACSNFSKLINLKRTFFYVNNNFIDDEFSVVFTDPIMSLFSFIVRNKNKYRFIQADDYRIFDDLFVLKKRSLLLLYKFLTFSSYKLFNVKYFFNSKYAFKSFNEVKKSRKLVCKIVHPAIRHEIFFQNETRVVNEKPSVGIVARKHPLKGFKDFLSAMQSIDKDLYSNVFIISHDDLSSFNLSGMMLFRPNTDRELVAVLNKIDIFISTSWHEGFGLPPLEAMACGCSVIVSDSGGVNEYAVSEINCLMYQPRNVNQLVECVNRMLIDEDLRNMLSIEGLRTSRCFSWENSTQQLIKILN